MPKKPDIVTELRRLGACDPDCWGRCSRCPDDIAAEAATVIERLRAKNKRINSELLDERALVDAAS